MTKFKAAGIHLLISFTIVALVLTAMYYLWFPGAYFSLLGGKKLISLIGFVDVFLGPLLTLIVFKAEKKTLNFDLFCIGVIQVAALSYGVYVMFESRPVFTVFNKDQFQIAAVVDITPEELAKAKIAKWRKLSIAGPELVAIGMPDKNDRKETMFAKVASANAFRYPRLYDQYSNHIEEVIKSGKPLEVLKSKSSQNKTEIDKFIVEINQPESNFIFIPISSVLANMSVIVDKKTGELIKIIDAKEN
jgi:hypothetical protein